jgi:hypothetical protein
MVHFLSQRTVDDRPTGSAARQPDELTVTDPFLAPAIVAGLIEKSFCGTTPGDAKSLLTTGIPIQSDAAIDDFA